MFSQIKFLPNLEGERSNSLKRKQLDYTVLLNINEYQLRTYVSYYITKMVKTSIKLAKNATT